MIEDTGTGLGWHCNVSAIVDEKWRSNSFLHADEIQDVQERTGGVVDGQVVDRGAAALGFYHLLVGGILVGRRAILGRHRCW